MTDVAVRDLGVVYQRGGEPAVDGVSFELRRGDGLLIAGDPGAGKTSVLRALMGLVVASGDVTVFGHAPGDPALAGRIGYGPQGRTFTEAHSPRAIVRLVGRIRGIRDAAAGDDALERAGIPPGRRDSRALDMEELRRVALACALAGDPDLLVLDDPWEFPETVAEIARARERGAAVLAASHDPGGLPDLLGRTITLVNGSTA